VPKIFSVTPPRQYTNKSSSDVGAFVLGFKELGRASQLFYSRFEMMA